MTPFNLSGGNLIIIPRLVSISHLPRGKKYKFFIFLNSKSDVSIIFLSLKNSLLSKFPNI